MDGDSNDKPTAMQSQSVLVSSALSDPIPINTTIQQTYLVLV